MSFETLLRLIKTGDSVSAGVANRPIRQIDQNVRYIWEVLQAAPSALPCTRTGRPWRKKPRSAWPCT